MGTVATSLIVMRWGLVSAAFMYFASAMKTKCQQHSFKTGTFACSGLGLFTSCWFVTSLFGIDVTWENWQALVKVAEYAFSYALRQSPDIYLTGDL